MVRIGIQNGEVARRNELPITTSFLRLNFFVNIRETIDEIR